MADWARRWVRTPAVTRELIGRTKPGRFHLGDRGTAGLHDKLQRIWAYCGVTVYGSSEEPAFEECDLKTCDDSQHCVQCTKSLNRRLAGRPA